MANLGSYEQQKKSVQAGVKESQKVLKGTAYNEEVGKYFAVTPGQNPTPKQITRPPGRFPFKVTPGPGGVTDIKPPSIIIPRPPRPPSAR